MQAPANEGREAAALLTTLLNDASSIPKGYWSARDVGDSEVEIRGAVLLRPTRDDETPATFPEGSEGQDSHETHELLSKALEAARDEAPARPALELWQRIREDGLLTPCSLDRPASILSLSGGLFSRHPHGPVSALSPIWRKRGTRKSRLETNTENEACSGLIARLW